MKSMNYFLVSALLLVLAGCSPMTSTQAVRQNSTQLSSEQIFALVADNSLVMSAYDFSGTVYFDRNGQLAAIDNEKQQDVGKWDLTDENQLCLKFRIWYYGDIKCYTVYDNAQADRLTFFTTNGAAYYTAMQVEGDPASLTGKLEKASPPRTVRRQIAAEQDGAPSPTRDVVISPAAESDSDLTAKRLAGDCPGCTMTGMDLKEASLVKANLQGADLSGADLRYANLRRANLSGANLQNARLNHANLPGANLTNADLRGADLTGANLLLTNLTDADVNDAIFTNANLEKTIGLKSTP